MVCVTIRNQPERAVSAMITDEELPCYSDGSKQMQNGASDSLKICYCKFLNSLVRQEIIFLACLVHFCKPIDLRQL